MSTPQQNYSSSAEWKPAATAYGSNVGRTSAHSAARLVSMVNEIAPINAESKVLDVGAGAGAVTVNILTNSTGASVTATDLHQSMLDSIQAPPDGKLIRQVADARELTKIFTSHNYSHVLSTFMLQTIVIPLEVLREMHAMLQPNSGVVGIACWGESIDPFDIWEKGCQKLDPSYKRPLPYDDPNAWQTEEAVSAALLEAGFKNVRTERLRSPFPFEGTDKFVEFWFGDKNPAALKTMSNWKGSIEEVKKTCAEVCREQYDDGRAVCTSAVLGIGRA